MSRGSSGAFQADTAALHSDHDVGQPVLGGAVVSAVSTADLLDLIAVVIHGQDGIVVAVCDGAELLIAHRSGAGSMARSPLPKRCRQRIDRQ